MTKWNVKINVRGVEVDHYVEAGNDGDTYWDIYEVVMDKLMKDVEIEAVEIQKE